MASNDYPSKEERDLLNKLDELDREADQWRNAADSELWERYDAEYRGEAPWLGRRVPKFLVPAVRSAIDRRNALLTETKPVIRVVARKPGLAKTCEILTKTIEASYDEYSIELQLERAVQVASVIGAVFGGLPWNRWARWGEGDIEPSIYDPRSISIDPLVRQSYTLNHVAQYTIKTDIWPLWEIQRRFPGRGMLVKPERAISSTQDRLDTGGGRVNAFRSRLARSWKFNRDQLQQGPVPRATVKQYLWRDPQPDPEQPDRLRYPDGRMIIRGGPDVILSDEHNPYWGGDLDLEMLDLRPAIDSPWGTSEVEAIRRINEAVNRVGNLFVDNAILGGNLVVVTDSDALEPDTVQRITNAAGLVITKRFGRSLDWKPPPSMPPHMLQFIQTGLGLIDYLIGLSDGVMQGNARMELRSGAQIEGLQSAAQVLVRYAARRVEGFLERLGQTWIKRIFQFFTDDRLITFLGPSGDFKQFEFERAQLMQEITDRAMRNLNDPKHANYKADASSDEIQAAIEHETRIAWRDFAFRIVPGSSLAATKIQRAQLSMQLAQAGMLPRRDVLLEAGFDNPSEKLEEAKREAQEFPPPQAPEKGGGRGGRNRSGPRAA